MKLNKNKIEDNTALNYQIKRNVSGQENEETKVTKQFSGASNVRIYQLLRKAVHAFIYE
jgi:hypothetical protein